MGLGGVGVMGRGEGVDGLGGGEGLVAEGVGFAALCEVEEEDAVGKGGDAGVVPERTGRNVRRLAFRGCCPAVVYGPAKAIQPVEGDLLEFDFAESGRCRRERIARHRSFDHLRTSNDFIVIG